MMPRVTLLLLGLLLIATGVAQATIHQVNITGFDFVPAGRVINQGDSIRWTNMDGFTHTSTSDNGVWNSGNLLNGQSYTFGFSTAGSFPYHCAIHITMKDTITVLAPADVEISIGDNFFEPPVVQINVGDMIQWTNNGAVSHTATAGDGTFDSGTLTPGQSFSFTFNQEGVHDYECTLHPGTVGTVVVGKPDSVAADIQIVNMQFVPDVASITVGEYVRWINFDPVDHTSSDTTTDMWDSGTLEPGDVFTLQGNTPGSFDYVCLIHPGQTGTLNVIPVIDQTVMIEDNFFDPAVVQIQPGQTVLWVNMGIHAHSSTSDTGVWDSDSLAPGEQFFFTFPDEGVFDYHCLVHPLLMNGSIVVGRPDSVAFDIQIVDFNFVPGQLTMSMGQNVRWVNYGAMTHTTTDTTENHWNSGDLSPGDFFILHADSPGDFYYICQIHPGQNGLLTVLDTASSGCAYVPGDINGNGSANGIDVTYGVGYFKGGSAPPIDCGSPVGPCPQGSPFYAGGDVNGNCAFNGIDITFFVSYLKGGQPALLFCPSCSPAAISAPGAASNR